MEADLISKVMHYILEKCLTRHDLLHSLQCFSLGLQRQVTSFISPEIITKLVGLFDTFKSTSKESVTHEYHHTVSTCLLIIGRFMPELIEPHFITILDAVIDVNPKWIFYRYATDLIIPTLCMFSKTRYREYVARLVQFMKMCFVIPVLKDTVYQAEFGRMITSMRIEMGWSK